MQVLLEELDRRRILQKEQMPTAPKPTAKHSPDKQPARMDQTRDQRSKSKDPKAHARFSWAGVVCGLSSLCWFLKSTDIPTQGTVQYFSRTLCTYLPGSPVK